MPSLTPHKNAGRLLTQDGYGSVLPKDEVAQTDTRIMIQFLKMRLPAKEDPTC